MNRAVILINKLIENANPDEEDVIIQSVEVEKALNSLGYLSQRVFVDLNLQSTREALGNISPGLVFNLVETLGGRAELIHLVPALLESMHIPFTGSGAFSMLVTSDKLRSKDHFRGSGIPTAEWLCPGKDTIPAKDKYYIVKPVWEDGSVGITDESVMRGDDPQLHKILSRPEKDIFAEEYIHGREFNLSLLYSPDGPEILPPAQIRFVDYPEGKPHILNYDSKWKEDSFEYKNSVRSFDFPGEDMKLLEELKALSYLCWRAFELRGYARVDFRVDANNKPYVLEVNANPCISPDAGYIAAAEKAGMSYSEVIKRIISDI